PDTAAYGATTYIPGILEVYNTVPGGLGADPVPAGGGGNDEFYQLAPGVNAPPGGGLYSIDQLVDMGVYKDIGSAYDPTAIAKVEAIYNLAGHQTLAESLKREAGTAALQHTFSPNLIGSLTVLYARTITGSTLNAQPVYPQVDNSADPWLDENLDFGVFPPPPGSQYLNYTAPTNPFSLAYLEEGETTSTDADGVPGYPSGNDVIVHQRFVDYPRIFQNTSTQANIVGQLDGKIGDNYSWTGSIDYSRQQLLYENMNVINAANFLTDVNDGAVNPFAIDQPPGALPGNLLGTAFVDGTSTLTVAQLIFRGTPYRLPAGRIGFAFGISYAREVFNANADQNSTDNGWLDAPSILPIDAQRKWVSLFAEIEIPVFGGSLTFPGMHALNVDVAGRNDDYYGVADARTPKISMKYEPFGDDFAFRATASKSFAAPPMYDLYGPVNSGSSESITYTPLGSSQTISNVQFEAEGGSNPKLQPATGSTWTLGFVMDPKLVKGLNVSFDFFEAVMKGLPGSIDEQTIIQSVEDLGPASPYAGMVHFGTVDGAPVTAPGQISTHPEHDVWIFAGEINIGSTAIKGWDAAADYRLPTAVAGTIELSSDVTFYNSYMYQAIPTEDYYQYAGTVTQNLNGTVPRYRLYSTLDWTLRGWEFITTNTFIPSVADVGSGGSNASAPVHVGSYLQEDFAGSYHFGRGFLAGLTLTVGVDNAFNRNIPPSYNAMVNTNGDVGEYDGAIGRMWYGDIDYTF
ncbi:MAG: hypothetical protein ACREFX_07045, partial [Opitutaceae bacterium]